MTTYRLIIKGDRFQAARAAADRGIGLVFKSERRIGKGKETYGITAAPVEKIVAWFVSEGSVAPELGFPAGTLLYYREV